MLLLIFLRPRIVEAAAEIRWLSFVAASRQRAIRSVSDLSLGERV